MAFPQSFTGTSIDLRVVKNSDTFGLFVLDKTGGDFAKNYLDTFSPQTVLGLKRYWSFRELEPLEVLKNKILGIDSRLAEASPEVYRAEHGDSIEDRSYRATDPAPNGVGLCPVECQTNRFRKIGTVLETFPASDRCPSTVVKVKSERAFLVKGPRTQKLIASRRFEGQFCRPAADTLIFAFSSYDKVLACLSADA